MKIALNCRIQAGDIQSPNGSSSSSTVRGWICAGALLAVGTLEKKEERLLRDKSSAILLSLLVTYVAVTKIFVRLKFFIQSLFIHLGIMGGLTSLVRLLLLRRVAIGLF